MEQRLSYRTKVPGMNLLMLNSTLSVTVRISCPPIPELRDCGWLVILYYLSSSVYLVPIQFVVANNETEVFTKEDWEVFEATRQKYKHNRNIYTDHAHICVKEVPSQLHARAAALVQIKLMNAIVSQLLPRDDQIPDDELVISTQDGRKQLLIYFPWS